MQPVISEAGPTLGAGIGLQDAGAAFQQLDAAALARLARQRLQVFIWCMLRVVCHCHQHGAFLLWHIRMNHKVGMVSLTCKGWGEVASNCKR
jgi:hypothetical protein